MALVPALLVRRGRIRLLLALSNAHDALWAITVHLDRRRACKRRLANTPPQTNPGLVRAPLEPPRVYPGPPDWRTASLVRKEAINRLKARRRALRALEAHTGTTRAESQLMIV